MKIIKVNATESSNTFARNWYQATKNSEAVCIWVEDQTLGRGQRGASWLSYPHQNLTFSIIYPAPPVALTTQFLVSQAIGLGVLDALQVLRINGLNLKWPNDIMAAGFKIGGILIENILGNGLISASIIGIGLNINQISFPGLPKASSLKLISGKNYEIEEILPILLHKLEERLEVVNSEKRQIRQDYEDVLFRRNKVSTFQLLGGKLMSGIIKGVTTSGFLKVEVEEEGMKTFDLKQLKLLF